MLAAPPPELTKTLSEMDASTLHWAGSLLDGVLEDAAQIQRDREAGRQTLGIPTGIPSLDRTLNGLNARGLYILGGAPGAGKTSLMVQLACEAARRVPVLYVTYENSPSNLVLKAVCRLAVLSPSQVERGKADLDRLAAGAHAFSQISHRIALLPGTSRVTLETVREQAKQVMAEHGAPMCLIVVDYLQRMAVHQAYDSMADAIAGISLGMRELAADLNSPIVAISSLTRSTSYDLPTLQGLQGSEDLEFAADVVLLLGIRQEVSLSSKEIARLTTGSRLLDLVIAKNRYGEAGKRISLMFRPTVGDFEEDTRA